MKYGESIGKRSLVAFRGAWSLLAVGVRKICFVYDALHHSYCPEINHNGKTRSHRHMKDILIQVVMVEVKLIHFGTLGSR